MKRKTGKIAALACVFALVLSGCGSKGGVGGSAGGQDVIDETLVDNGAVDVLAAGAVATLDVTDLFSDRDKEIGYEEEDSARIILQEDSAEADSENVRTEGSTVTITGAGTYILSGRLQGQVAIDAEKADKIQLVLDGAQIICADSAALYVKKADKVFVTTAAGSENLLETTGGYVQTDDNNVDGAVFSKDDITFNGSGTLRVVSASGNGIVSKDDLAIASGVYEVTAAHHGLEGKDCVKIASGTLTVTAEQDGIHSGNDEDDTVGYTYIGGGDITLTVGDDGIHSDAQLVIAGGNVTVTDSYEGLEGASVEIAGGTVSVKAGDDGLNAAGGSDGEDGGRDFFAADSSCSIILSGGRLTVDADGDGLDSNGTLQVSGGEIVIYGPANGGNGALDYGSEAVITGGTIIALGSSQMAVNFGSSSTQGTMLVNVQEMQAAGTAVRLTDQEGSVLAGCTAKKAYNSAVISCPGLEVGQSYTVTMGSAVTEVELTEIAYGSGNGFGGMGGHGHGGFGGMDGFGPGSGNGFDPGDMDGFGPGDRERPERGGRPDMGEPPDLEEMPDRNTSPESPKS